jgi:hypothetical protein
MFWPERAFEKFGDGKEQVLERLREDFYQGAFKRNLKDWRSEGSAPIYCATRTLPLFLRCNTRWTVKHSKLVASIYEQLGDSGRFGIGEKTTRQRKTRSDPEWYPENAYHTYWALVVLGLVRERCPEDTTEILGADSKRIENSLRLWAKAKLTEEIGLHWANSAALDSDQLTWALTTFIDFEADLSADLGAQDLVRRAFEALGATQQSVGTWRHYRPLFVYSNVGNAYCFVYESFTYLLKAILKKFEREEFLEDVVRGFADRLRGLRCYAEMTQVRTDGGDAVAWSSGHRPVSPRPEGWATASVFSFLQAYRRLLGILVRRDALRLLPRRTVPKDVPALRTLADRGDTWVPSAHEHSVAEDLVTLFVNPVQSAGKTDRSEPDSRLIDENQARSAILFGPPGNSKTTLAQAVAAALEWDYVELHSSHFVAEGIQAIQSTADRIFGRLKELDRTVILFDEPDELVREREGAADAFGRFLTTSMLPKVAELWKQRRVIFFVATNHIRYFDAAITRSERFDVLILVPPPSFEKKKRKLRKLLVELGRKDIRLTFRKAEIEEALKCLKDLQWSKSSAEATLPEDVQLAKFIMLRFDQLDELSSKVNASAAPGRLRVDAPRLTLALAEVKDLRLSRLQTYVDYVYDLQYSRKDFHRIPVFKVRFFSTESGSLPAEVEARNGGLWLPCPSGKCPETIAGYRVVRTRTPGEVKFELRKH